MKAAFVTLLLFLVALPAAGLATEPYPFEDPYKATVFGCPPDLAYTFADPVEPSVRDIRIHHRRIPHIFWYDQKMYYSTAMQSGSAPLIFLIAGTGAEHDSAKMRFLTRLFYEAGYHVVAISSPTHMNFLVSVSQYAAPGYVPYDVADLYRVMGWIKQDLEGSHDIESYSVAGYSLGALHSAFVAELDSSQNVFDFQKVLMVNPPVSLYRSVLRLDALLGPDVLQGRTVRGMINDFIDTFADYYRESDVTDLDDDFLYELCLHADFTDQQLKVLIGVAFRMGSSSMIFASDVCLDAGYIVPAGYEPTMGESLLPYAEASFQVSFEDYMDEYLLPFVQFNNPRMTREQFLAQESLEAIRSFLENNDRVVVIGNLDDPILGDDDVRFLQQVFGPRVHFFTSGGHCGNMMYAPFAEEMVRMVRQ